MILNAKQRNPGTVPTPAAGQSILFVSTLDGQLYVKDSTGTATKIGGAVVSVNAVATAAMPANQAAVFYDIGAGMQASPVKANATNWYADGAFEATDIRVQGGVTRTAFYGLTAAGVRMGISTYDTATNAWAEVAYWEQALPVAHSYVGGDCCFVTASKAVCAYVLFDSVTGVHKLYTQVWDTASLGIANLTHTGAIGATITRPRIVSPSNDAYVLAYHEDGGDLTVVGGDVSGVAVAGESSPHLSAGAFTAGRPYHLSVASSTHVVLASSPASATHYAILLDINASDPTDVTVGTPYALNLPTADDIRSVAHNDHAYLFTSPDGELWHGLRIAITGGAITGDSHLTTLGHLGTRVAFSEGPDGLASVFDGHTVRLMGEDTVLGTDTLAFFTTPLIASPSKALGPYSLTDWRYSASAERGVAMVSETGGPGYLTICEPMPAGGRAFAGVGSDNRSCAQGITLSALSAATEGLFVVSGQVSHTFGAPGADLTLLMGGILGTTTQSYLEGLAGGEGLGALQENTKTVAKDLGDTIHITL